MISIVFASNFFNHHEKPFCDELNALEDVDFRFVQTEEMTADRVKLGWGEDLSRFPYVVCAYGNNNEREKALALCRYADILILGSAPYDFVAERVKGNRPTFYYAERLFRKGIWHMLNPGTFLAVMKRFVLPGRKSNFYLLAASGYTAYDTARIGAFNCRRFKWGHFIDTASCVSRNFENKTAKLLWVGRFLQLKHPEYPVKTARSLKDRGVDFHLDIIGTGPEEDRIRKMIAGFDLGEFVTLHGSMSPGDVRGYMERADIYMFTSDFNEGWGAVLGEAMASGCVSVASHAAGATPFLARHEENALIFKSGDYASFEREVIRLVEAPDMRKRLSEAAVATMRDLWAPRVAARRFYTVCKAISEGKPIPYFDEGPMSEARILKNNWFEV